MRLECDCPTENNGILPSGPKTHRPGCPTVAFINEIIQSDPPPREPNPGGGFIPTPSMNDISSLQAQINLLTEKLAELEALVRNMLHNGK